MDDTRAVEAPDDIDGEAPTRGFRQRAGDAFWSKTSAVLSAVLVIVLIGCVVWLATSSPTTPAPATPQAGPGSGACGPAGELTAWPPTTAPPTTWVPLGAMGAPTSPTAGPADTVDGIPTCFAPTPTGALFTAATFFAALSDSGLRTAAFAQLCADTVGRHAALSTLALDGPGPSTIGVLIAGYSFEPNQPPTEPVIRLALLSSGAFSAVPFHLTWTGSDWRIVLPVTGRPFDARVPLANLSGYVSWQSS